MNRQQRIDVVDAPHGRGAHGWIVILLGDSDQQLLIVGRQLPDRSRADSAVLVFPLWFRAQLL